MDNHTIYKGEKKPAEQQPEEEKKSEKVESPGTMNYIKCTQAH